MNRVASITPPGLPAEFEFPAVDVGSILRGGARRYGDRVAFYKDGTEVTYTQLLSQAAGFANALNTNGIGQGDVVAVHLPNCLEYPAIYFGIMMSGAAFGPTNPLLPPHDLAFQLGDCGATAVVTWGPASAVLQSIRDEIPARLVITVDAELPDAITLTDFVAEASTTPPAPIEDAATKLAHIAYTGGTTGRSKGVLITHANIIANVLQSARGGGSVPALDTEGDLILDQVGSVEEWPTRLGTAIAINLTPWFHAMGAIGYLSLPIISGMTTVLHSRFDPGAYLADAERFQVTIIGGAPPIFVALIRHPDFQTRNLSSVRGLASGAAPLPVAVIEALEARFPDAIIGEGYGLTEVTMAASGNPGWRSGVRKPGTVGISAYATDICLMDPAGVEVGPGETGEVCVRGPQVMQGYHNRPDATAETLRNGWLHTGDIGSIDEDGYLSIVDRAKDMLLYKGYNVYPRELEEILHSHPDIAGAAVVGRKDEEVGELPVAFVKLRDGIVATPQAIQEFVNERVVPYKKLREVHLVDEIPVSAAGKVLRRELRESLADVPTASTG